MLRLREKGGGDGSDDPDQRGQDDAADDEDKGLTCRACGVDVSSERHIFPVGSDGPIRAFANPYGQMLQVLTVKDAWSVRVEGWSTADFTWFAGYAWRILYCDRCSVHLGWRFEAELSAEPAHFFGLLTQRIRMP